MKKNLFIILGLTVLVNLLFITPILAEGNNQNLGELMGSRVEQVRGESGMEAPSVAKTIGLAVQIALSLLATIFLILVIIAGYKWMMAGGNEEIVREAQRSLKQAIIGLVIVLAAYGLTYFIFNNLPIGIGEGGMPGGSTGP